MRNQDTAIVHGELSPNATRPRGLFLSRGQNILINSGRPFAQGQAPTHPTRYTRNLSDAKERRWKCENAGQAWDAAVGCAGVQFGSRR